MTDNTKLAAEQAAGLRKIADMIEQNPALAENFSYDLNVAGIGVHLCGADKAAEMASIARIARRHGATTTKDICDKFHNMILDFSGVKALVIAYREEVCERVVVETKEIVEEVPDPAAVAALPKVKQTRIEEVVEWKCSPILGANNKAALAATAADVPDALASWAGA